MSTSSEDEDKEQLVRESILKELKRIAAHQYSDLNPSDKVYHKIELKNPSMEPIKQKINSVPFAKKAEFRKMI